MQIPILNGVYASSKSDLRTSYPKNLVPVAKGSSISGGYLRPADGITTFGSGAATDAGADRGGINWNGVCYRALGTNLVSVSSTGAVTVIGAIGGTGTVTFDYGADRLAVASNEDLFYYDGTTLTQVTDANLGTVLDLVWIDGYFLTTDGAYLVVTELNDPTAVDPLKYGSSEVDPDSILAVKKIRNELYALNRHTAEVFQNVGGDGFPFSRVEGAQIPKGTLGTHANCVFMERLAFLGGGRNESPSIWLGANGQIERLATREVDMILEGYTEEELSTAVLESRSVKDHNFLYVHLPDRTLVYDFSASQQLKDQVWFTLCTGLIGYQAYQARHFVYCYDKWIVGNPEVSNTLGVVDETVSSHYGDMVGWEFGTSFMYNEGRGAIVHELELVSVLGNCALGAAPVIWSSYSIDGVTWSQDKACSPLARGNRDQRLVWFRQGIMRQFRIQRFKGTSDSFASFMRLEAKLEGLN